MYLLRAMIGTSMLLRSCCNRVAVASDYHGTDHGRSVPGVAATLCVQQHHFSVLHAVSGLPNATNS